ncbi:DUF6193 family natural product biosynthesis protein [Streptomyces sp. NPDC056255]|uniref:DUF6193 family natural product biosynthesis protein n=1 Tax=Streptomyces sp. NPDC056255 TaxID=3345764 RepID=UPI0035DBCF3F
MNSSGTTGPTGYSGDPRLRYYADLVERGGLWAAIVSVAREHRVDIGVTAERPESKAQAWSAADFASPRGAMRVNLGHGARRFAITLDSNWGYVWASGSTADLAEVVEVMAFWRQGAKLKELGKRFPFMEFDSLSQAYEDGNPVETQWDIVIGDDNFLVYRELLLALHADPNLREMFPFFSHWTLRMAKDCYDSRSEEILIKPSADEGYVIWSSSAPEGKREFSCLDDLIHAAVSLLGDP